MLTKNDVKHRLHKCNADGIICTDTMAIEIDDVVSDVPRKIYVGNANEALEK